MRTRLFHTIVLFGATLGGATACSDGGEESEDTQQETSVGGSGSEASGGSGGDASGGATAGGASTGGAQVAGSAGWPPTK
jgi:hypothetical protein